jgi:hypothetical protein
MTEDQLGDSTLELLDVHRKFFAELMTAIAGVPHSPLTAAFASTPRERYLGPGPCKVYHGNGYPPAYCRGSAEQSLIADTNLRMKCAPD